MFLNGQKTISENDSYIETNKGFGFEVSAGKEFRVSVINNLELRYGLDFSFSNNRQKQTRYDKSTDITTEIRNSNMYYTGVKLVLGLNYVVNENFVIGAEILPSFYYSTGAQNYYDYSSGEWTEYDISGFSYGLDNNLATLTLLYRF